MLDYKLLQALAAVVEYGGFEKAARVLHITQSAVSQRVRLLEEQTGSILLVRSTPPSATTQGQTMLRHYRQVKRLEDDLDTDIGADTSGLSTLPVALNADSMATWFFPAVDPFLAQGTVLLDLRVDDQDQTHVMLRDGDVLGCISSRSEPFQGCRAHSLGLMDYHLCATPQYVRRWFPDGVTPDAMRHAPQLFYNRRDELHHSLFTSIWGESPSGFPISYVPSTDLFPQVIAKGTVSGMLPHQQALPLLADGTLVDLFADTPLPVRLYWHCWNLESETLTRFTKTLVEGARDVLPQ